MDCKDTESTKLLYNLNIKNLEIERNSNSIKDYLTKMNELRNNILRKASNKESFSENKENIKHNLLLVGSMFFCYFIHVKQMINQFDDKFEENQNPFIIKSTIFPGSHDYCVALARTFNYDLYINFYKNFLDEIDILISSKGTMLPRFLPVITIYDFNKYNIGKYVLLTKKDLGYNPPLDKDDYKKYCKIWEFAQLDLPCYYLLCEKLVSKEKYYELFSKYIKNNLDSVWNKFLNGEYKLYKLMLKEKQYFIDLKPVKLTSIN